MKKCNVYIFGGLLFFLTIQTAFAQTQKDKDEFLQHFSGIAVHEMNTHGIPASIKLAQAICETTWGTSKLAKESNNFFGIKCKSNWDGDKYYKRDDEYNADGTMKESCFRAYMHATHSFEDHSLFLVNRNNYKKLFTYSKEDYTAWAYGLLECGYATDKSYAEKLIKVIEDNALYEYDRLREVRYAGLTPIVKEQQQLVNPSSADEESIMPEAVTLPDDYEPGDYYANNNNKNEGEKSVSDKRPPLTPVEPASKNNNSKELPTGRNQKQRSKYDSIK